MMIDTGIIIAIIALTMTVFFVVKVFEARSEGWTPGKAVVLAIVGMLAAYTYMTSWNTITDFFQTFL